MRFRVVVCMAGSQLLKPSRRDLLPWPRFGGVSMATLHQRGENIENCTFVTTMIINENETCATDKALDKKW
ncbi:MAG: hypothetical protein BJ554DRAFT_2117 [Olpidium bornovanus]|uniref:Uncharacterized protein n=1 Tax=Olpidium bornovanus TaxID=278681 RepID=A0A8H7ZRK5_9FUNG|nr:MAG: hypothetical protein BJ554DRAFT_2117 [Olpidium bornovanus]